MEDVDMTNNFHRKNKKNLEKECFLLILNVWKEARNPAILYEQFMSTSVVLRLRRRILLSIKLWNLSRNKNSMRKIEYKNQLIEYNLNSC